FLKEKRNGEVKYSKINSGRNQRCPGHPSSCFSTGLALVSLSFSLSFCKFPSFPGE
ncbi:unnamed protein product, partial [Brassica oleracea]